MSFFHACIHFLGTVFESDEQRINSVGIQVVRLTTGGWVHTMYSAPNGKIIEPVGDGSEAEDPMNAPLRQHAALKGVRTNSEGQGQNRKDKENKKVSIYLHYVTIRHSRNYVHVVIPRSFYWRKQRKIVSGRKIGRATQDSMN